MPLRSTLWRLLTFRISRDELLRLDHRHLILGLVCTWLVGMGRYWDDPGARLAQHLGLGSLAYVFVLSAFLWLLLLPLGPAAWSLKRLLTFVTLVSPPALLYAIPVERFTSLSAARSMNAWFLAIVAAWRVALLIFYLVRLAELRWYKVLVGAMLPLTLIITALTTLNLERAVFDIMSGIRADGGTANDLAYEVLFFLSFLSTMCLHPAASLVLGPGLHHVRAATGRCKGWRSRRVECTMTSNLPAR